MDEYIGTIKLFAFNFVPTGWFACNGQTLPINQYMPLFALIGTTYGGDGRTNFMLPNLEPHKDASGNPVGIYCLCHAGIFPQRS